MAVTRSSLPDQVFRTLLADVLEGKYAAGERLPTQRALAADLGVNMASLREGIKRLEQLRLVEVKHGDAMRVTDWRTSAGLDVLAHAAQQFSAPLFEARRILLTEAAHLAAERRTDEQAGELDLLAAGSPTQWTDLAFMATVIEAADNLVFSLILNSIREIYVGDLERYATIVADREAYRAVAVAIRDGDADAAERAMAALAGGQEEAMRDQA